MTENNSVGEQTIKVPKSKKISGVPNFDKRNTLHIYIRKEDKVAVKRFLRFITQDTRFEKLKEGKNPGLVSIAIAQLIRKYVNEAENLQIPGVNAEFLDRVNTEVKIPEDERAF